MKLKVTDIAEANKIEIKDGHAILYTVGDSLETIGKHYYSIKWGYVGDKKKYSNEDLTAHLLKDDALVVYFSKRDALAVQYDRTEGVKAKSSNSEYMGSYRAYSEIIKQAPVYKIRVAIDIEMTPIQQKEATFEENCASIMWDAVRKPVNTTTISSKDVSILEVTLNNETQQLSTPAAITGALNL